MTDKPSERLAPQRKCSTSRSGDLSDEEIIATNDRIYTEELDDQDKTAIRLARHYYEEGKRQPYVFSDEDVEKAAIAIRYESKRAYLVGMGMQFKEVDGWEHSTKVPWLNKARSILASLNLKPESEIRKDERRKLVAFIDSDKMKWGGDGTDYYCSFKEIKKYLEG